MYIILFLTKLVIFIVGMCNNVKKYDIHKLANIKINLKVNRPPLPICQIHMLLVLTSTIMCMAICVRFSDF